MQLLSHAPRGFFAIAQSHELGTRPVRRWFSGLPLALFRDEQGVAALVDACPHRGVPLTAGFLKKGQITCPYHGYRFSSSGQCTRMPGLSPDQGIPRAMQACALEAVEQDGLIWVCATRITGQERPPRLLAFESPSHHTMCWPLRVRASLPQALENFLDGTHTHYVHRGLIRAPRHRRPVHVRVTRAGLTAEAHYEPTQTPKEPSSAGLFGRLFGHGIDRRVGRYMAPGIAQLEYGRGDAVAMVISALFCPHREGELHAFAVVTTKHVPFVPDALARAVIRPLFRIAIAQDARILSLAQKSIEDVPGRPEVLGPLDVLRPHIAHITRHGTSAPLMESKTLWL